MYTGGLKRAFVLMTVVAAVAGWRYWSHAGISRSRAEEIAALRLIGKRHFSPSVPVEVRDGGETYKVMFTFDVPAGAPGAKGKTYKSYAVVRKKDGEVLELGVMPPGT